jgi:hypothetical protein
MTAPPTRPTDPAFLTRVLRRRGLPEDVAVARVAEEKLPALISNVRRLRLDYDGPDTGAPRSMIVKTSQPERSASNAGRREVGFYRDIASYSPPGLFAQCYDADWNEERNEWHLLIEDLGETHFHSPRWPMPPTEPQWRAILTAWARFHAAWWDDPRLGVSIGQRHDEATSAAFAKDTATHFVRFSDEMGDRLTAERRAIFERCLDAVPRLFARHRSHRDVTIAHGDAHPWNVMLPKNDSDDVRLFDWSDWRVGMATNDLAYMMATHWYPDRRRRLEQSSLDHYHDALLAHGVSGYGRDRLAADYRLSTLLQIFTPVWQNAFSVPAWVWWGHHERTMLAFEDLGLRDLL